METNRLSLLYNIEDIYNENKLGSTDYQLAKFLLDHYTEIPSFIDKIVYQNFKIYKGD